MISERDSTHNRLLAAAAMIFSAKGFAAATTRESCRLADANDASVCYHFTDKRGIYKVVLGTAARELSSRWTDELPFKLLGATCLRVFIRQMMVDSSLHARIVMNEFTAPTDARAELAGFMRTRLKQLSRIIESLNGSSARARDTRLTANSILAQVTLFYTARPAFQLLWRGMDYNEEWLSARLADHVAEFCLKALHGMPAAA